MTGKTVFQFRLTREEKRIGTERAKGLGMSLGAMLRKLMVGELCQERGVEGVPLVSKRAPAEVPKPVVEAVAKDTAKKVLEVGRAHAPNCRCLACRGGK